MMAPGIESPNNQAKFDPSLPKMQINLTESIQKAASEGDQIKLEHQTKVDELDSIKKSS